MVFYSSAHRLFLLFLIVPLPSIAQYEVTIEGKAYQLILARDLVAAIQQAPADTTLEYNRIVVQGPLELTGDTLRAALAFEDVRFTNPVVLERAVFLQPMHFVRAHFQQGISLLETRFEGGFSCRDCRVVDTANCKRTVFADKVDFSATQFSGAAFFQQTDFGGETTFERTQFEDAAYFDQTVFARSTSFQDASFADLASFKEAGVAIDRFLCRRSLWRGRPVRAKPLCGSRHVHCGLLPQRSPFRARRFLRYGLLPPHRLCRSGPLCRCSLSHVSVLCR